MKTMLQGGIVVPTESPIGYRPFTARGECAASVGHTHNYDHVTLRVLGDVLVQVVYEDVVVTPGEDRPVSVDVPTGEEWFLTAQREDCDWACCGLRMQRVEVGDGRRVTLDRRAAMVVTRGKGMIEWDRGLTLVQAGEDRVVAPGVEIELSGDDLQIMLVSQSRPGDCARGVVHGGDFCAVLAGNRHRVKSKSSVAHYRCLFPHRGFDGVICERYEAAMGNWQAYT